jgi:hypothetical protein
MFTVFVFVVGVYFGWRYMDDVYVYFKAQFDKVVARVRGK